MKNQQHTSNRLSGNSRGRNGLEIQGEHRPELLGLLKPNGRLFTLWAGLHLLVWLAGAAIVFVSEYLIVHVFAVLLLANQLHALTILQHDCGHGSAYQNSRWNTWVGRFLAWFIFMPFTTFTEAHKRHHKYLGDPHNDPDEWFYANGGLWLFARECVFVPRFVYISLTRYGKQTARTVWFELLFNTMSWALLLALALQTDRFYELTMIMLLPVALLACVINPISRGYEHYPLTQLEPDDARRLDLRYNTVTVTNRWLGLMWANITYHVEHHMYPRAPFYRLPRINELMRDKSYIKEPLPLYSILNRKLQLTVRNNEN